ncbi:MAG: energy-coupling factor transporter transmembrane protein EcfT [Candidatus Moduliflexus flocculans]|nr:energy-coupling factor transporter transmembrane protein EcfT [Candidatus Moduliflexus flocculans]
MTVCLLVPVLLSYDHVTPLVYLGLGIVNLAIQGGLDFPKYLRTLAVLSLVSLGLFALNALFPAEGTDGVSRGTAVFLRKREPDFPVRRVYLCRRSLRPGASPHAQAAPCASGRIRPVRGMEHDPLLRRDLGDHRKSPGPPLRRPETRACPTACIPRRPFWPARSATEERVALSMAARGVESGKPRTFLKDSPWTRADSVCCAAGFLASGVTAWIIVSRGALRVRSGVRPRDARRTSGLSFFLQEDQHGNEFDPVGPGDPMSADGTVPERERSWAAVDRAIAAIDASGLS